MISLLKNKLNISKLMAIAGMTMVMFSACQQKKQSDSRAQSFPPEKQLAVEQGQPHDAEALSDMRQPDVKVHVRRGQPLAMQTEGLTLTAVDAAVQHEADYSVTSLVEEELPPLPQGMMNMTASSAGYRLLPGGEHFSPYAELRVAYDPERLPTGYTAEDIYTSYYDTTTWAWVRLERLEVDTIHHEIVSATTHFTDFINELLKSPEMPETQAFVPTALTDLEAVNPMDGLTMIQPPTANNNGTANLSYPLAIPAGRGGMQPNLALTYSSTGGSGWLGVGWDISVPSITLDTRWGVPRYDATYETEIYMLNGEQLVAMDADGNVLNMPHRTNNQTRRDDLSDAVRFIARTGDAHDSIIRYGNSPKNYWWKVIDRNGVTHYYGRYDDPDRSIEMPVVNNLLPSVFPHDISFNSDQNKLLWKLPVTLCDDNDNIARWVLTESRDLYGNTVRYYYDRATVKNRGAEGRQLYLDSISYTGKNQTDGYYTVVFCRTGNSTPDVPEVCNNGFKEITDQLLNNVYLKCGDSIETLWHFETMNNKLSNYKNRLVSVTKIDTLSGMTMRGLLNNLCHCIQYDDDEYGTFPQIHRVNGVEEGYDTVYIAEFDTVEVPVYDTIMTIKPDPKNHIFDTIYEYIATGNTILRIRVKNYSMRVDTIYTPSYEIIDHREPKPLAEINPLYAGSTTRFEYYDAPTSQELFSGPETSNFTSQNLHGFLLTDMANITPLGRATALGLNTSSNWSVGGTAAAGLGLNVCLTTVSLGGNYTRSGSSSESMMTLVDLDGDGLADKVYVKNGAMYFCRQYWIDETHFDFRPPQMILGARHFLKESSTSNTFGVQASIGASASANWTNTKSTTSTYFADVNGDGLVDLVDDGQVLFNHLRASDRVPVFSPINTPYVAPQGEEGGAVAAIVETLDTVCQEIIFDGAVSDSIDCRRVWVLIDTFRVTPDMKQYYTWLSEHSVDSMIVMTEYPKREGIQIEIFRREWDCSYHDDLPNTDAVRVWVAPRPGYVDVHSEIGLIQDTSASRRAARNADGVVLTVQRTSDVYIDNERFAYGTNYELYTAALCDTCYFDTTDNNTLEKRDKRIYVETGDIIFFRLRSKVDHNFDDVYAHHIVKYCDNGETFDSEKEFVVSSEYCFQAPVNGTFTITGEWNDGAGSAALHIKGVPANVSGNKINHTGSALKDENICIEVYSRVGNNIDWGKIVCRPYIIFTPAPGSNTRTDSSPEGNVTVSVDEPIEGWLAPHMNIVHTYPQYKHPLYRRLFGPLYKGWGQFAYHTEGDNSNLIRIETLVPSDMMVSGNNSSHDQNEMNNIVDGNNVNSSDFEKSESLEDFEQGSNFYNPYSAQSSWVEMNPDAEHWVWVSYGHQNTIGRQWTSNSLRRDWYSETPNVSNVVDNETNTQTVVDFPETTTYDDPVPPAYNGAPAKAVRKVNRSKSHSWSIGFAQWGISKSGGSNTIETDYMDLNGDRYPDIIGTDMVQYSQQWGGVGPLQPLSSTPGQGSHTDSKGASFSASAITQERTVCGAQNNAFFTLHSEGSRSVNGGGNIGHDYADATWMDMNGDGLVDLVYPDGRVKLNIGYGFLGDENWDISKVRNGISGSISAGVGVQGSQQMTEWIPDKVLNVWQGSIEAGAGISGSYNQTTFMLMDINGDGLPDKLWRELNDNISNIVNGGDLIKTKVSYNLGCGEFSSPESLDIGRFHSSASFSESLNLGFTYGFTLWGFKVTLGLNGCPYGGGVTQDYVQLADVNADGLPDLVYSTNEREMSVRFNKGGKTNLLKSVTNHTNSSFVIDYTLSDASYEQPSRGWLMTKVTTNDPLNPNGGQTSITEFSYDNPRYDRVERMSYGFDSVVTKQIDPDTHTPLRYVERGYNNRSLMKRGKLTRERTYDGGHNLYVEKLIDSWMIDYNTCDTVGDESCPTLAYPAVEATYTKYYEGGSTPLLVTGEKFEYDRYHNVIRYTDLGDFADTNDGFVVEMDYYTNQPHNLIGLRKSYKVKPSISSTVVLREANFNYDGGKVSQQTIGSGPNIPEYNFKYDDYGNLMWAQLPENDNHERVEYAYTYDNLLHTYPDTIMNISYNEYTKTTYNYRFGKPMTVTDPSGNIMRYSYDYAGRLISVNSPMNSSTNPSVKNRYYVKDYFHNAFLPLGYRFDNINIRPYAITEHYDDYGYLITRTVAITDGFGRVLQTKKGLTKNGVPSMQVSGRAFVDALGRTISQYDPFAITDTTFASLGQFRSDMLSSATVTTYDPLDRVTEVHQPLNIITRKSYNIQPDDLGRNCFYTQVIDPKGNITHQFTDYEGRQVQLTAENGTEMVTTIMVYDRLGQLEKTQDPEGFVTHYGYDNFGRLKYRDHPDAGFTEYFYDPAGNVTRETNPLGDILYEYTYYRLKHKRYSNMDGNDVIYKYGTSGNDKGRPVFITDGSGSYECHYDALGNAKEETRTIVLPGHGDNVYHFHMEYNYDSWGRMQWMTYPDGETVVYNYIWGGDLISMAGNNPYINDIIYNDFGQRERVNYGNGTYAEYYYDALHRLSHLVSYEAGGATMQEIDYTFDAASNIELIQNSVSPFGSFDGHYENGYSYDALHRLVGSDGDNMLGHYTMNMEYSPSGRITRKYYDIPAGAQSQSMDMYYGYCNDYQPHTVRRILDKDKDMIYDMRWDKAGNLGQVSMANLGNMFELGRFLFWTEDNRMHVAVDDKYYSYYAYDHSGERRLKLTGDNQSQDVNADFMTANVVLKEPTLYPSAYMVLTNKGYTKHYYAGTDRVAACLGGGWLNLDPTGTDEYTNYLDREFVQEVAQKTFDQSRDQVNERVLGHNEIGCIQGIYEDRDEFHQPIMEIPERVDAKVELKLGEFFEMAQHQREYLHDENEYVYFYHSDHLGSASWITNHNGEAVQHLQYLPYGEPYVNIRTTGYSERFTFTGKERDEETGYGYFGARYMDHVLTTMWLSVDPMADKYPSISPYAYCAWNPVKLVDPDGQEYGDYFSSTGVWLGSDGINDGKLYRQVEFTDISYLRNDYVEVGTPYSYAGTYEYVGDVTNITMDYTGTMAPDKNNNPHIAKGVFTITFHVGDQEFVRGKYEAWSGCNCKDGSVRYPLQNGKWMLANSDRSVSASQKNSYTRDNACFKIDLSPVGFTSARYGIQIHPDGGADGTAGCIGIRTNPSDFYNAYKSCVSLHPNLIVNVNIKNNPNNNVPRK